MQVYLFGKLMSVGTLWYNLYSTRLFVYCNWAESSSNCADSCKEIAQFNHKWFHYALISSDRHYFRNGLQLTTEIWNIHAITCMQRNMICTWVSSSISANYLIIPVFVYPLYVCLMIKKKKCLQAYVYNTTLIDTNLHLTTGIDEICTNDRSSKILLPYRIVWSAIR